MAELVRSRREELELSQHDAADAAGISDTIWSRIETASQTSYRPRTLRGIARALSWTPGSVSQILAGGEPEVIVPPANGGHGGSEGWPQFLEEKYDHAVELAARALREVSELRDEIRKLAGED